ERHIAIKIDKIRIKISTQKKCLACIPLLFTLLNRHVNNILEYGVSPQYAGIILFPLPECRSRNRCLGLVPEFDFSSVRQRYNSVVGDKIDTDWTSFISH